LEHMHHIESEPCGTALGGFRNYAMQVGYLRTSTTDQLAGLEAQRDELTKIGCEKLYQEQNSGAGDRARPKLEAMLDFIRVDDVVTVTRLDRLARSTRDLLAVADRIKAKGGVLRVLNLGGDTGTATGQLVFTIIAAIAEFERALMLERQKDGIAAAKLAGKYKGRVPTAMRQAQRVRELDEQGLQRTEIARQLGIGRTSVYRALWLVSAPGKIND
jgi:DNA invertase Pin-like site-specific DNA recombinase